MSGNDVLARATFASLAACAKLMLSKRILSVTDHANSGGTLLQTAQ